MQLETKLLQEKMDGILNGEEGSPLVRPSEIERINRNIENQ